jgi:hypothetical protein
MRPYIIDEKQTIRLFYFLNPARCSDVVVYRPNSGSSPAQTPILKLITGRYEDNQKINHLLGFGTILPFYNTP